MEGTGFPMRAMPFVVAVLMTGLMCGHPAGQTAPRARPDTTALTVKADAAAAAQQLYLTGVRSDDPAVQGFRVYLNPRATDRLDTATPSLLTSVFFTHKTPGTKTTAQDFALVLPESLRGTFTVVLAPIAGKEGAAAAASKILVESATVHPVDNSQFR